MRTQNVHEHEYVCKTARLVCRNLGKMGRFEGNVGQQMGFDMPFRVI